MNGKERNLSHFRKLSAYIMQDNQLHGNLTVEEAMTVATSLKLSTKVTKDEKILVVSGDRRWLRRLFFFFLFAMHELTVIQWVMDAFTLGLKQ